MEIIQTDSCTQFTSKKFQEGISLNGVLPGLAAKYLQEIKGQVEERWWTLQTIGNSMMVHAKISG